MTQERICPIAPLSGRMTARLTPPRFHAEFERRFWDFSVAYSEVRRTWLSAAPADAVCAWHKGAPGLFESHLNGKSHG
jgi:hypothetical protein